MRTYYYYSKKTVQVWHWTLWFNPVKDFTIIIRIVVNPLKYEFKRIVTNLRITSMRIFTHTKK